MVVFNLKYENLQSLWEQRAQKSHKKHRIFESLLIYIHMGAIYFIMRSRNMEVYLATVQTVPFSFFLAALPLPLSKAWIAENIQEHRKRWNETAKVETRLA